MSGAFLPMWILGAPFIGILILSAIFKGGTSASTESRPMHGAAY